MSKHTVRNSRKNRKNRNNPNPKTITHDDEDQLRDLHMFRIFEAFREAARPGVIEKMSHSEISELLQLLND